jgi:hypothetical protein
MSLVFSGFGYPEAYKTPFQSDRRWQGLSGFAKSGVAAKSWSSPAGRPHFTRLRACGSFQRNTFHIVIGLATLTREA